MSQPYNPGQPPRQQGPNQPQNGPPPLGYQQFPQQQLGHYQLRIRYPHTRAAAQTTLSTLVFVLAAIAALGSLIMLAELGAWVGISSLTGSITIAVLGGVIRLLENILAELRCIGR